jgi:hypothetical protein
LNVIVFDEKSIIEVVESDIQCLKFVNLEVFTNDVMIIVISLE